MSVVRSDTLGGSELLREIVHDVTSSLMYYCLPREINPMSLKVESSLMLFKHLSPSCDMRVNRGPLCEY